MLEWEVGDEVMLTEYEFAQFVQDDWGWKQQFRTTGMEYIADSSATAWSSPATSRAIPRRANCRA